MFTSFKRIIVLGWQNMARDSGVAVANVFIIMIPILLTSALFSLKTLSDFLVKGLQEKADISVYFNESVPEDDILRVKDKIKEIAGIDHVEYVSKDQALLTFRERHRSNEVLLESLAEVNGNPLFSSLNVSAASPEQFDQATALLAQDDYKDLVNKVNYNEKKEVIQKIFAFTEDAQKSGLILFAVLGVISIIVTFNTVRMAILSRKREIGIQRLVGASHWFVRGQFLVEGLIFGLLAAVFSLFIASMVCWYASPALARALPGMDLWQHFSANLWTVFSLQLAIGAGLGVFSSLIAVSRHLKV
jgi:cell division transport system permease protein